MRWYLHQKASGVDVLSLPEDVDWQMIVFDVDGTLMDKNGYPEGLLQRIRKLEELQLTVSLASGRTLPNVTPIQQTLAVSGFIVAENGGMVWDSRAGFAIARLADGERARSAATISMLQASNRIGGVRRNGAYGNQIGPMKLEIY